MNGGIYSRLIEAHRQATKLSMLLNAIELDARPPIVEEVTPVADGLQQLLGQLRFACLVAQEALHADPLEQQAVVRIPIIWRDGA